MSPEAQALLLHHLPRPSDFSEGESALMPTLMRWLVATGRLRTRTLVAHEVPWLGRRVDLALLTQRGMTTAFELKIGRLQRVLEQGAYNRSSFHRSWVVTGNRPKPDGIEWARELGLGLIVIQNDVAMPLVSPLLQSPPAAVTQRLRTAIRSRAGEHFA
ncbi:hypothetical protein Q5424_04935 [Conexibacter sp. JD483]|uniref:hypothetical protein n=1 Tax=unclassified Conexibacter TaxID=2627773 RepID=UPI00271E4616|nr:MULTISPECIES: hypothetical protein [unclassified Conexibacter]MDO8184678.1 hypothetical protein [Conexibacter sp. CPCC 205706]MDO8197984.1 hypothetical protein [Conexibacter sp. CPCC 205762]MDR9368414.1 hypothetical protein [Conexibacter sp. JD483]